jgi:hypothetical protein
MLSGGLNQDSKITRRKSQEESSVWKRKKREQAGTAKRSEQASLS